MHAGCAGVLPVPVLLAHICPACHGQEPPNRSMWAAVLILSLFYAYFICPACHGQEPPNRSMWAAVHIFSLQECHAECPGMRRQAQHADWDCARC